MWTSKTGPGLKIDITNWPWWLVDRYIRRGGYIVKVGNNKFYLIYDG